MTNDPYKTLAKVYDRFVEPLNSTLRKIVLKGLQPQKDMAVLEIGCGTGTNLKLCKDAGCKVSGIDLSPAMIEQARSKLGAQADLRLGDASDMPFTDNSFDIVLAMLTLHEMPGTIRQQVLKEMQRVLKPEGRLLCIDFHPGPLQFPKGWFWKVTILFFEISAGREHFRNYRHFIAHKGLQPLLEKQNLTIEKEKIIGGGNIALYTASRSNAS
jgi:ubiquinone/menaquinone biosynthesis C-methylase UbiE